jgi:8-oxo-dGTP diphosphatase
VRRQDTGILALMGGFTEVGETSLETVSRELMEEMNISTASTSSPTLFGVYNDPKRDARRHTTSVVFIIDVPDNIVPKAGDDATNVLRIPLADVYKHEFFVDHKTIIRDFIRMKQREQGIASGITDVPPMPNNEDGEPFKRAICPMK